MNLTSNEAEFGLTHLALIFQILVTAGLPLPTVLQLLKFGGLAVREHVCVVVVAVFLEMPEHTADEL
jgi:hypothetical protein